jgi:hypothetical protein
VIAAVIFEHVNTPLGEAVGIIDLMVERSGCPRLLIPDPVIEDGIPLTEACTGHLACTAVHTILQPLAVKMIRYRLQAIGEFAELGLKLAVLVTAIDILPAVIQDDVIVS